MLGAKLACRHALRPANPVTADHSDRAAVQPGCSGRRREEAGGDAEASSSACFLSSLFSVRFFLRARLCVLVHPLPVTCQPPVNAAPFRRPCSLLLPTWAVLFGALRGSGPVLFALATMAASVSNQPRTAGLPGRLCCRAAGQLLRRGPVVGASAAFWTAVLTEAVQDYTVRCR